MESLSLLLKLAFPFLILASLSAQEIPKPGLPVPEMIMDKNGAAKYGEIWHASKINDKYREKNATLSMLAVKPHEYFRVADASTGGRTDNKLYRFFVIRGKFLPPEKGKYTFSYHGRDGGLWFGQGNDMPGELIVKVADNGRYGRTRFAAKSFELEKGDACNLMMIYPQYQGDLNGGARMGYKLERDGNDPVTVASIPLSQLELATGKKPDRIVEIWRNASTGLDRKKIQALWGTKPDEVKKISQFEFPQELHGRAAFKDSLFVIRGYFIPPKTSRYTMTLSKRVQGIWGEAGMVGKAQLWFQSNPDDRTSLRMVSSLREKVGGVNTPENEKGFALTKGKKYYFEYLHEYGSWQRRTGMAGGFRNSDGDIVVRMEKHHFESLSQSEMEDLRSTVPSVVSGNLKKEDKKEVVGKVVSGAVILASITHPVEVINAKINKKLPTSELKPGKVISEGFEIKVGKGGNVVLLFSNGTVTTLAENTNLVLKKFKQEEFSDKPKKTDSGIEPSVSDTLLEFMRGDLVVDVKKLNKKSNLVVTTPLGVAGIRGTRFRVMLNENSDEIFTQSILVTEGTVYCKPTKDGKAIGMEFDLNAGEKVTVSSDFTLEKLLSLKALKAEKVEVKTTEDITTESRRSTEQFSANSFFEALKKVNTAPKLTPFQRLRQRVQRRR